jgi:hypothetical protein
MVCAQLGCTSRTRISSTRFGSKWNRAKSFDRARGQSGLQPARAWTTRIGISFDETTTPRDIELLMSIFRGTNVRDFDDDNVGEPPIRIPQSAIRTSEFLTHPIFNTHDTETEMLRYLKKLESRDLSLTTSMIPLGSCTMKFNATAEMFPISWPEFPNCIRSRRIHKQAAGYRNVRSTRRLARGNHRIRRGFIATECRIAGRIRGSAGDSRISRLARRSASQRLSHSDNRRTERIRPAR